jgi:hypothetical protein
LLVSTGGTKSVKARTGKLELQAGRFHGRRKPKLKPGRIHTGVQEKAEIEKTDLVLLTLD